MFRSIVAVIVGFVVIAVLVMIVEGFFSFLFPDTFPPFAQDLSNWHPLPGFLIADLAIGAIAALLGGVTTGAIAKGNIMKHVYGLGALIVIFAIARQFLPATAGVSNMPMWHTIVMPIVGVIGAVAGGRLWEIRQAQETSVFDMEPQDDQ